MPTDIPRSSARNLIGVSVATASSSFRRLRGTIVSAADISAVVSIAPSSSRGRSTNFAERRSFWTPNGVSDLVKEGEPEAVEALPHSGPGRGSADAETRTPRSGLPPSFLDDRVGYCLNAAMALASRFAKET